MVHHQRPFQIVPGFVTMEAKRPVREADHAPPSNAKYSYTSASQDAFMTFTRTVLAP